MFGVVNSLLLSSLLFRVENGKFTEQNFEWNFRLEKDHRDHPVQIEREKKSPKRMNDVVLGYWNLFIKRESS